MSVQAFNKLAIQLLSDMSSVFPELITAKEQIEAIVKHDNRSTLPMVLFESTNDSVENKNIERYAFGIEFDTFMEKLSAKNRKKVQKYFDELSSLLEKTDLGTKEVANRMRILKESNALEEIDNLLKDPSQLLSLINDPSQLESLISTMKQNPELAEMANQVTKNFKEQDVSSLMQAAAPALLKLQFN